MKHIETLYVFCNPEAIIALHYVTVVKIKWNNTFKTFMKITNI